MLLSRQSLWPAVCTLAFDRPQSKTQSGSSAEAVACSSTDSGLGIADAQIGPVVSILVPCGGWENTSDHRQQCPVLQVPPASFCRRNATWGLRELTSLCSRATVVCRSLTCCILRIRLRCALCTTRASGDQVWHQHHINITGVVGSTGHAVNKSSIRHAYILHNLNKWFDCEVYDGRAGCVPRQERTAPCNSAQPAGVQLGQRCT